MITSSCFYLKDSSMKQFIFITSLIFQAFFIHGQDSMYFNNIYQHQNNFAWGMTILETDDGYVGYAGTEDPENIGQMLLFFKIDHEGNEVLWKPYGENYHDYYFGNVGGAMIKTFDNSFVMVCHFADAEHAYATLIKLNENLDTIWKRNFNTNEYTIGINCKETTDHGFILTGWVWDSGPDLDVLLLKTDSNGIYQWHQTYGGTLVEQGETVIQTPDGGCLIGGFRYDPAVYHSLNALVIKTDSLGNEEWTKTFGNPNVDDDMALVAMADDGNYLVATVYGEWIIAPGARTGRIFLVKIDSDGNTIWSNKIGHKRMEIYMKNLSSTNDGNLIASSFFMDDTTSDYPYIGNLYKFTKEGDSIWMRDYYYYNNQYDWNMLYDVYPCSDKGYIGVGLARPDMGTEKLWIIKVDSMGCDTAGCATGTFIKELPASFSDQEDIRVYPNPAHTCVLFQCNDFPPSGRTQGDILITNTFGQTIIQLKIIGEKTVWDCRNISPGFYFYHLQINKKSYTGKFLITK